MPPGHRVIFIGLCACDPDLLLRLARTGEAPHVAALLDGGLSGPTVSVPLLYGGATWTSFQTGLMPGGHGAFDTEQLETGTYRFHRCRLGDRVQAPPFWRALSDAGRRVAVLDVPDSPPPVPINGVNLVDWGAHDADEPFAASPAEFADEVKSQYGAHPIRGRCDAWRSPGQFSQLRDDALDGVARKLRLTRDLMIGERWDFLAQVFTEAHTIGHLCWHLHDRDHPKHDPAVRNQVGDPVVDVYRALDHAIGALRASAGDDATFVVLASHGMRPSFGTHHLLDQILLGLGLANRPGPSTAAKQSDHASGAKHAATAPLKRLWRSLPERVRAPLQPALSYPRRWLYGQSAAHVRTIDAAGSLCFIVHNGTTHGGLRINLRGRDPSGLVRPGEEFDSLCGRIANELRAVIDVDTGQPVISRVVRAKDVYEGPRLDDLPDLLIEWSPAPPAKAIASPSLGEIRGEHRYCRTGDHHPRGLFVARGPGIAPGRLEEPVSIVDFAPTLAQLLAVPLSATDGQPIPGLR